MLELANLRTVFLQWLSVFTKNFWIGSTPSFTKKSGSISILVSVLKIMLVALQTYKLISSFVVRWLFTVTQPRCLCMCIKLQYVSLNSRYQGLFCLNVITYLTTTDCCSHNNIYIMIITLYFGDILR